MLHRADQDGKTLQKYFFYQAQSLPLSFSPLSGYLLTMLLEPVLLLASAPLLHK